MKKYISLILCLTYFLVSILNVNNYIVEAMSVSEINKRTTCGNNKYEVAIANIDGSLTSVECVGDYNSAKQKMNDNPSDDAIILYTSNNITEVIDAKLALIDYDQYITNTILLYKNIGDKSSFTYVKGGSTDDAAFISYDNASKRIKIKLNGFTGYMDKYDSGGKKQYDIVPLNFVKSSVNYVVDDKTISLNLPSNLNGTGSNYKITYGKKPEMLDKGTYYSYDGIYFYTNRKDMLKDYVAGNYNNSVNKEKPYYNYYLYVSHRTKSTYSKTDIDDYVKNILGYNTKIINGNVTSTSSMLYNEGYSFYSGQELYGTNAIMMFSVARNESGNGRSTLSYTKNNIFGHNAVDSDPYGSASGYESIQYAIYSHAYKWLSYGFLQPGDINNRFNGSNLGNKAVGVNVKYASDAYWGIKAASYYYKFDSVNDFQDYNYYRIAVKNDDTTIYAKKNPTTNENVSGYYKLTLKDTPIVIVGEETGLSVNGNNKWYKIMSDPYLDNNLNYVGSSTTFPRLNYNWDHSYVYVPAANFTVINPEVEIKTPSSVTKYEDVIDPDTKKEEVKPTATPTPTATKEPTSNLPSTTNPASSKENKDGNLYYFESMKNENNTLSVSGFLGITGMNNKVSDNISHRLIFKNDDTGIEYVYNLNRWTTNVPFEMINTDEKTKYDYSGGWFKGNIDISNLPDGDYKIYIEMNNDKYKTRTNFNNLFYKDMVTKMTTSNKKGFKFGMNYYNRNVPMEVSVRSEGLITTKSAPTTDTMYNSFEKLELSGNTLHILGASHNVGVNYSANTNVSRQVIIENTSTFKRYSYYVSSITNGPYKITLRSDDKKDKTRAWYDARLNIASLPSGVYAIYVKTSADGFEDYGELNDILYTTINMTTTINGKKVYLRRVDAKRFRIELVIE